MRFLLIFILNFLLTGCAVEDSTYSCPPPKSQLVREISSKVFRQLREGKNLYLCEWGGEDGGEKIKFLHCGFFYYNEIDIEKARELLFTAGNRFLNAFNTDERIHTYLNVHPLKPENIQINIFLKKSDGSELGFDTLHVISISRGSLNYMIRSSATGRLETILLETYEEATAKLNTCAQLKEAAEKNREI